MTVPGKIRMTAGLSCIRGWWSHDPERERLITLIRRHTIGMHKAAAALAELDRLEGRTEGESDEPEFD